MLGGLGMAWVTLSTVSSTTLPPPPEPPSVLGRLPVPPVVPPDVPVVPVVPLLLVPEPPLLVPLRIALAFALQLALMDDPGGAFAIGAEAEVLDELIGLPDGVRVLVVFPVDADSFLDQVREAATVGADPKVRLLAIAFREIKVTDFAEGLFLRDALERGCGRC